MGPVGGGPIGHKTKTIKPCMFSNAQITVKETPFFVVATLIQLKS